MSVGINNEEMKQRAQYLNMRGAQMAMENAGQEQNLESAPPKGTKKQLIGTIVGAAAALLVLVLLALFKVI